MICTYEKRHVDIRFFETNTSFSTRGIYSLHQYVIVFRQGAAKSKP